MQKTKKERYYKDKLKNVFVDKNTTYYEELPISSSRADCITLSDKGIVYEIKTDLDSLQRLSSQISDYYKAFSMVYVVVGKKHLERVIDILDNTPVGIYELTERGFVCHKTATIYNSKLSYNTMFQMLRKKEFEKIVKEVNGELPKVNDFVYYRTCLEIIRNKLDIISFQKYVINALKERIN